MHFAAAIVIANTRVCIGLPATAHLCSAIKIFSVVTLSLHQRFTREKFHDSSLSRLINIPTIRLIKEEIRCLKIENVDSVRLSEM